MRSQGQTTHPVRGADDISVAHGASRGLQTPTRWRSPRSGRHNHTHRYLPFPFFRYQ